MKDLQRFFYALKRSCSVFMDAMKASDKVKKTGGSFSFMMHPVIDPELNVSGSKSSAAQPGSDSVQSSVVVHDHQPVHSHSAAGIHHSHDTVHAHDSGHAFDPSPPDSSHASGSFD